jgi:hypothetical protein
MKMEKRGERLSHPVMYDKAEVFEHGLAQVWRNGLTGALDKSGVLIVPFGEYDDMYYFDSDVNLFPVIKDGFEGWINSIRWQNYHYFF